MPTEPTKECPDCSGEGCKECRWRRRVTITRSELVDRLSIPTPYFREGSTEPSFWGCGHCRTIHAHEVNALKCYTCAPKRCSGCDEWIPARDYCEPCSTEKTEVKNEARFQEAKKIHESDFGSDEPVCDADGKYYTGGIEELRDCVDPQDQPRWVWSCSKHRLQLDIDQALQHVHENVGCFDDWDGPDWDNVKGLAYVVKRFNASQSGYWWEEDSSCAVLLDPPEWLDEDEPAPADWPTWDWDVDVPVDKRLKRPTSEWHEGGGYTVWGSKALGPATIGPNEAVVPPTDLQRLMGKTVSDLFRKGVNVREISDLTGISRSRICQLIKDAREDDGKPQGPG